MQGGCIIKLHDQALSRVLPELQGILPFQQY